MSNTGVGLSPELKIDVEKESDGSNRSVRGPHYVQHFRIA
jgi:hypothetical protein